jgi:hypothetical protein
VSKQVITLTLDTHQVSLTFDPEVSDAALNRVARNAIALLQALIREPAPERCGSGLTYTGTGTPQKCELPAGHKGAHVFERTAWTRGSNA